MNLRIKETSHFPLFPTWNQLNAAKKEADCAYDHISGGLLVNTLAFFSELQPGIQGASPPVFELHCILTTPSPFALHLAALL